MMSPAVESVTVTPSDGVEQAPQPLPSKGKRRQEEAPPSSASPAKKQARQTAWPIALRMTDISSPSIAPSGQHKSFLAYRSEVVKVDEDDLPLSSYRPVHLQQIEPDDEESKQKPTSPSEETKRPSLCRYIWLSHYSFYPKGYEIPLPHLPPYQEEWLYDSRTDITSTSDTGDLLLSEIPHYISRWLLYPQDHYSPMEEILNVNSSTIWIRQQLLGWLRQNKYPTSLMNRCIVTLRTIENRQWALDIYWPKSTICDAPDLGPLSIPAFKPALGPEITMEYELHGPRCAPYEITIKVVLKGNDNIIDFKDTFNEQLGPYGAVIIDIWKMFSVSNEVTNYETNISVINDLQWNGTLVLLVALHDRSSSTLVKPSLDPIKTACELPDSVTFDGALVFLNHLCERYPRDTNIDVVKDSYRAMSDRIRHDTSQAKVDKPANEEIEAQTAIKLLELSRLAANDPPGGNYFPASNLT